MGCLGHFFKYLMWWKWVMWAKCAYCILTGVAFILAGEFSTFSNAKYIACLSLGYTLFRFWGDHKPSKEIATVWFYL
jgi:hypothetical protein